MKKTIRTKITPDEAIWLSENRMIEMEGKKARVQKYSKEVRAEIDEYTQLILDQLEIVAYQSRIHKEQQVDKVIQESVNRVRKYIQDRDHFIELVQGFRKDKV